MNDEIILTREERLQRGDILTSSEIAEKYEQSSVGGVSFARLVRKNLIEYIFLANPKK